MEQRVSVDEIKLWEDNPRDIDKAQFERLKRQLAEMGQHSNLLLTEDDKTAVGGNMRTRAYRELAKENPKYRNVRVDWLGFYDAKGRVGVTINGEKQSDKDDKPITFDTRVQAIASYALSHNYSAGSSNELAVAELATMHDLDMGLHAITTAAPTSLEDLPSLSQPETEEDEPPPVTETAVSVLGTVYQLGRHRLMCGDSTKSDDVRKLMDGNKANMAFTDPPWNVAIGMDSNPRHRQRPGLDNDSMSTEDFKFFIDGFSRELAKIVSGDIYCVLGASEWPNLDAGLRANGFHWSATIIWVKDMFVLGRSKYHRRYEPLWYGWHKDGKSSFGTARDLDDVWEINRPRVSEDHPTMKPVQLVARAIANSSQKNNVIVDLFGGGGSTLIAAHQLNRIAYLMELDPKYCDVIRKRYWKLMNEGNEEGWEDNTPAVA